MSVPAPAFHCHHARGCAAPVACTVTGRCVEIFSRAGQWSREGGGGGVAAHSPVRGGELTRKDSFHAAVPVLLGDECPCGCQDYPPNIETPRVMSNPSLTGARPGLEGCQTRHPSSPTNSQTHPQTQTNPRP